MKIEWTHEADALLAGYVDRASQWSDEGGRRLAERILRRVQLLEQFPLIGRMVPEYEVERLREIIEPPYRIIYQVYADRVEIVTIRHSAEDLRPSS